jgi:hypothetical protein
MRIATPRRECVCGHARILHSSNGRRCDCCYCKAYSEVEVEIVQDPTIVSEADAPGVVVP